MAFRQNYKLVNKHAIRWFPGHMGKGIKQMQEKLRITDCIIEVHDARVPFSGRNMEFKQNMGIVKPHILVLNKKDLSEANEIRHIEKKLQHDENINHVIFTNCKDQQCQGIRRLLRLANELIITSDRYNRTNEKDFCLMIAGVPNVGKSSLINVLRNRHLRSKSAAKVGSIAGITRSVMEKIKISDDPLVYMIDTPGVLEPRINSDETGMKLAAIGCLPDHLVGEDLIADYLLYWMNRQQRFEYITVMGLEKPTDSIAELLVGGANKLGAKKKMKKYDGQISWMPDVMLAAQYFINEFRRGTFGSINLDKELKS